MKRGLHVLVADDDERERAVLAEMIRQYGAAHVVEVGSGYAAVFAIADARALLHLAIVSVSMPDIDGIDVARYVADLDRPPAVAFWAAGDPVAVKVAGISARARGLRVLPSLEKPPDPEALRQLLDAAARHYGVEPPDC